MALSHNKILYSIKILLLEIEQKIINNNLNEFVENYRKMCDLSRREKFIDL